MSLHSAFYGSAFRDAEIKESKSGSRYGMITALVPNGQDDQGKDQNLFIRVLAFAENVDELAKVKRNDRLYVEGSLDVGIYQSDKGPRPDTTLKAHYVRKTAIGKDKPKRDADHASAPIGASSFTRPAARERPPVQGGRDHFELDDALPF